MGGTARGEEGREEFEIASHVRGSYNNWTPPLLHSTSITITPLSQRHSIVAAVKELSTSSLFPYEDQPLPNAGDTYRAYRQSHKMLRRRETQVRR